MSLFSFLDKSGGRGSLIPFHLPLGSSVLLNKGLHVKFPLAAIVVHVAYLPKHWPLLPALVMNTTNRPHAA